MEVEKPRNKRVLSTTREAASPEQRSPTHLHPQAVKRQVVTTLDLHGNYRVGALQRGFVTTQEPVPMDTCEIGHSHSAPPTAR
ncbi:unnamed protein product [Vitrella brassicaformis CCMP3155]|uniref:Uncharacterized protein n=1 Tax=Vitrella brassicaformis (strain CCMP3155) TaxID=1169540 RepID=A0A0G4H3V9_VITBC|nr:unnamed protein product [Vitrella brassicaformis CCMP3155]|mmetsp:Transcript_41075/g.102608  ORF Transcript_41075/g.102608 Transcript_41075/m.102608 type:complete len:83 (+) Transcript_41075:99-347(+)|eukprot:CEM38229.1 unnamed protein product [Vitrella brassicaformis CCMP3155]